MNESIGISPSLPFYASLPTLMLYALLMALVLTRTSGAAARFLLVAISIRLTMSAFPHYSFAITPVGLSWNAVVSIMIVAAGLAIIRRGRAFSLIVPPIALLMTCIIISAIVNRHVGGIEVLVKYAYFTIIALLTYDAFGETGIEVVLGRLLMSFSLPFALQLESLLLNVAKDTEGDGSVSYIGGFNHEASFSIILVTAMLLAALSNRMPNGRRIMLILMSVIGIFLANYRTAILAMAPLLMGAIIMIALRSVLPRQRSIALAVSCLAVLAAAPVAIGALQSRFETLSDLSANPGIILQRPNDFRDSDRKLLSGRAYLWSEYLTAWKDGSDRQRLIGFGANSWPKKFRLYAHNTLISTLYELGYLGVASMLILWMWMLALALASLPSYRFALVTGHIGFLLLNMATMPLWMVEGLLFYGLLCGATLFAYVRGRSSAPSRNFGGKNQAAHTWHLASNHIAGE